LIDERKLAGLSGKPLLLAGGEDEEAESMDLACSSISREAVIKKTGYDEGFNRKQHKLVELEGVIARMNSQGKKSDQSNGAESRKSNQSNSSNSSTPKSAHSTRSSTCGIVPTRRTPRPPKPLKKRPTKSHSIVKKAVNHWPTSWDRDAAQQQDEIEWEGEYSESQTEVKRVSKGLDRSILREKPTRSP
jgi:hypothetical protein